MQTVNIAELKNNLSHYLRQVRQGNEITIKDGNRVIARIVPAAPPAYYDEELLELAAQGKVKLPEQPPDPNLWRTLKPAKLKTKGKATVTFYAELWMKNEINTDESASNRVSASGLHSGIPAHYCCSFASSQSLGEREQRNVHTRLSMFGGEHALNAVALSIN